MHSTYQLLVDQIEKDFDNLDRPKIILIAESSSNGFLDRSLSEGIKEQQDKEIVEKKALAEVKRYVGFLNDDSTEFSAGVAFFLYADTYDFSINLNILGVEGMESVREYIQGL